MRRCGARCRSAARCRPAGRRRPAPAPWPAARRSGCCGTSALTIGGDAWHRAHRPPPARARSRCGGPRRRRTARRSGSSGARRCSPIARMTYGAMVAGIRPSLHFADGRSSRSSTATDDVARRDQAHAAGVAVALHARDHRLRAQIDRAQHVGQRLGVVAGSRRPSSRPSVFIQFRSAPAQKAVPFAASTTARTSSSRAELVEGQRSVRRSSLR